MENLECLMVETVSSLIIMIQELIHRFSDQPIWRIEKPHDTLNLPFVQHGHSVGMCSSPNAGI